MMYMVAYFKKLLKSKLKQAWLNYCLINQFGRADTFMANNWFGEKIILLNKEQICLSTNTSSNKLLRETVVMNVIFFWKCQKAVFCTIKTTLHANCYRLIAKLPNLLLLVKHIIKDFFFCKQLGWTELQSNFQQLVFLDLFEDGTAHFTTGLE